MSGTTAVPADRPYATVTRIGRWVHVVTIHDGMMQYGPDGYGWYALGHRRAEHKARRELARYLRREVQKREPTIITTELSRND